MNTRCEQTLNLKQNRTLGLGPGVVVLGVFLFTAIAFPAWGQHPTPLPRPVLPTTDSASPVYFPAHPIVSSPVSQNPLWSGYQPEPAGYYKCPTGQCGQSSCSCSGKHRKKTQGKKVLDRFTRGLDAFFFGVCTNQSCEDGCCQEDPSCDSCSPNYDQSCDAIGPLHGQQGNTSSGQQSWIPHNDTSIRHQPIPSDQTPSSRLYVDPNPANGERPRPATQGLERGYSPALEDPFADDPLPSSGRNPLKPISFRR